MFGQVGVNHLCRSPVAESTKSAPTASRSLKRNSSDSRGARAAAGSLEPVGAEEGVQQGVIDPVFREDGHWLVVGFKTDTGDAPEFEERVSGTVRRSNCTQNAGDAGPGVPPRRGGWRG